MQVLGIHTGFDLRQRSRVVLAEHFGKSGDYLYGVARGVDERPVQADRVRKSVGAKTTFERDLLGWDEVAPALTPLFVKVWDACSSSGHAGRTVTVKLKYADFQQITRIRSQAGPIATQPTLERISLGLLRPLFPPPLRVRPARGHAVEPGGHRAHRLGPTGAWARVEKLRDTCLQSPLSDDATRGAVLSRRLFSNPYQ